MFKLYFYGASDNQFKFAKEVWSMHMGGRPVLVGNIPPGSYKILFTPESSTVKPQWWPNGASIDSAVPVTFTAGTTTGDIYYFMASQPTETGVTIQSPASYSYITTQAETGRIVFTAGDGYVWSAASDSSWIKITSPATGIGSGTVTYAVEANTYSTSRTGKITISGQEYTITQAGTQEKYGYIMIGNGSIPPNWYNWKTELGTAEFQAGNIYNVFKESADKCPDENYCKAGAISNLPFVPLSPKLLLVEQAALFAASNDGNAFLADITRTAERGLGFGVKLDTAKTYPKSDAAGEYFTVGYERDFFGEDRGQNRVSTEIVTADGNGTLSGTGKLACNGALCTGGYLGPSSETTYYDIKTGGIFSVGPDAASLLDLGYLSSDGKAMIISNPAQFYPSTGDDFMVVVGVKKGDKTYTSADFQGNWVFSSFGDEGGVAFSEFGGMTCDSAGNCQVHGKRSENGSITYYDTKISLGTVSADGAINGFYVDVDKITGAIGSNGNILIFTHTNKALRQMGVAIKSDALIKGDINGDVKVDLTDAVLTLKIMAGMNPTIRPHYPVCGTDVNRDGKVGANELLYILQHVAGLRQ